MVNDEPEFEDPSADPDIQTAYEAALGRFILTFNRLDSLATEVICTVLKRLGRRDLEDACTTRDFWLKLLSLDLLKSSHEGGGLKNVPVDLIREVAKFRNKVAHGHFDQNPFSGEYDIIVKDKRHAFSTDDIESFTTKAENASTALGYSQAVYEFDDETLK